MDDFKRIQKKFRGIPSLGYINFIEKLSREGGQNCTSITHHMFKNMIKSYENHILTHTVAKHQNLCHYKSQFYDTFLSPIETA